MARNVYSSVVLLHIKQNDVLGDVLDLPRLVWAANRNHPVNINATLKLGQDGNLVLADSDGTLVWSTNTAGKSVSGLNMTEKGNLVLFDRSKRTIWQSFDHPTDCLLPGQRLVSGQKLIASVSESNSREGLLFLTILNGSLVAYIHSDPPQFYYDSPSPESPYFIFDGHTLQYPPTPAAQFMTLEPDGHLLVYQLDENTFEWTVVSDFLTTNAGTCGYPMVCGKYGICAKSGQCSCPATNFIRPFSARNADHGCSLLQSIHCNSSQYHSFIELKNTTYFAYAPFNYQQASNKLWFEGKMLQDCKMACLNNRTCKAFVFSRDWDGNGTGSCLLLNEVFSLEDDEGSNFFTVFLKVQNTSKPQSQSPIISGGKKSGSSKVIIGATLGAYQSYQEY